MEILEEFCIQLDNPYGVYHSGENLSGSLIVGSNQPIPTKGIKLHFHGNAHVYWTESHTTGMGDDKKTETRTYTENDIYFNFDVILFGHDPRQLDAVVCHPAERRVYPFQFTLPQGLPCSFETSVGRVRYTVEGVIDRPGTTDYICQKPFTVLSVLDLNTIPSVWEGPLGQNSKTLGCLCCTTGPISAVFRLDRRGYVPGELIALDGEVDNQSNRSMRSSKVGLYMRLVYRAHGHSTTTYRKVAVLRKGEITRGDSAIWSGEKLQVPPVPPSGLGQCKLIDVTYFVQMTVDPSGPSLDLKVPMDVVIGTIPPRPFQGPPPMVSATPEPPTMVAATPEPPTMVAATPEPPPMAAATPEPPPMVAATPEPPPMVASTPEPPPMVAATSEPEKPFYGQAAPYYAESILGKVNVNASTHPRKPILNWAPAYPYFPPSLPDGASNITEHAQIQTQF